MLTQAVTMIGAVGFFVCAALIAIDNDNEYFWLLMMVVCFVVSGLFPTIF